MITTPFPTTPEEAMAWLDQGGDPNTPVMVRHLTTEPAARANVWWIEAYWSLYGRSGNDPESLKAWRDVVVRALRQGADPNVRDRDHNDPPPGLFGFGFAYDATVWNAWLSCPGVDLNALNPEGRGVLHALVNDRQTRGTMPVMDLLERLGTAGLDVNTHDRKGKGALHWMAESGSFTMAQMYPAIAVWLGEQGLDGERTDLDGWSGREWLQRCGKVPLLNAFEEGWSHWERRTLQALPEWHSGPSGPPRIVKRL